MRAHAARVALVGTLTFTLASAAPATPSPPSPLLVVVPARTTSSTVPSCALYHATVGTHSQSHILSLDHTCLASLDRDTLVDEEQWGANSLAVPFEWPHYATADDHSLTTDSDSSELSGLVWLHPTAVDADPLALPSTTNPQQLAFSAPSSDHPPRIPHLEPTPVLTLPGAGEGSLVRLSSTSFRTALAQLEYLTSHPSYSHFALVAVPRTSANDGRFPDVPQKAVDRVKDHLDGLRFSPAISRVLAGLDEKLSRQRMEDDVRTLSGEDQRGLREEEKWVSRHSMSEGAPKAAAWLGEKMRAYSFHCTSHSYLPNFAPMLECVYENSALGDERVGAETGYQRERWAAEEAVRDGGRRYGKNETVVLSAHYDSRGSFGYPTAPGADDDASGTALVLSVARELSHSSLRFARKLVLCLFSGEEQGLLSSAWYARRLAERGEDVVLQLQVDMVGFRREGEPMQLARPDVIGLPEAGWIVGNLSEMYVPELVVGYTAACCSDHQSFVANAFPATWIFERNGPIADPCYHNSCDLSSRPGYSFEQIAAHAKVALATVLEFGGFAYL
ncbi:hypothetical protein JCM10207_006096 [Rhodosporidiobolus poonsookiae]